MAGYRAVPVSMSEGMPSNTASTYASKEATEGTLRGDGRDASPWAVARENESKSMR